MFASCKTSLSLRTMGNVVKETRIPKKSSRQLVCRAATFIFGILSLNHALGAFASLRVSVVPLREFVLSEWSVLTKKLPG